MPNPPFYAERAVRCVGRVGRAIIEAGRDGKDVEPSLIVERLGRPNETLVECLLDDELHGYRTFFVGRTGA